MAPILRVHGFLPASYVNGPGRRAVVWVQGCTLACPGCFNPETHPAGTGDRLPVEDLFARINALDAIQGVTVSGGEPLQQPRAVAALLRRIKAETALSTLVFTGYTWDEAQRRAPDVLACTDVLLAGRYRPDRPKSVHCLTDRYTQADLAAVPPAEVVIDPDGSVVLSGLHPVPACPSSLDLDVERPHLDDRRLADLDVEAAP